MKRLLVIHRGSLGDFLLLLPALTALRSVFPEGHIEILGRPEILSLVKPGIADSIGSVERASLLPLFEGSTELREREIRYFSSFDAVLAYISDPEQIVRQNLEILGIRTIIVYPPFPSEHEKIHVGRYLFRSIETFLEQESGFDYVTEQPEENLSEATTATDFKALPSAGCQLFFEKDEIQWAQDYLKSAFPGKGPVVAIHPGSGSERKCWPPEKFEGLTRRLMDRKGCRILFLLGPADERLKERVSALAESYGCAIADSLPLRRLAALLSRCRIYVGNDSGVTHLAASVAIPTAAIFGPTDPALWAPPGTHVRIIGNTASCSPCTRYMMYKCNNRKCLTQLNLDLTLSAVDELLSR